MNDTSVDPAVLHTMAAREHDNADTAARWATPDVDLINAVLDTHGPQAAAFVEGLADYYRQRQEFGSIHAENYRQTGSSLTAAATAYTHADETSAAGLSAPQW